MELNENQKQSILERWNQNKENPPSLAELTKLAFPEAENLDGRSKEGRAVKAFLASRDLKAKTSSTYDKKQRLELIEEQKEFIKNNYTLMTFVEVAKVLFKDNTLTNLSIESITVKEYIDTLDTSKAFEPEPNEVPVREEYKPPRTFDKMAYRVLKYVKDAFDKEKIRPQDKKNVESLINYVNTYRFLHQINSYQTELDQILFESTFVRYTHDKFDLTEEEVDQYIILSSEVVISADIQRRKEDLNILLRQSMDESDGRASMALVEIIGKVETEYNQCVKRQQTLLNDLKEKRSDRLKKKQDDSASILNLVEMWKNEENRVKMLKLAEIRKQNVKEEISELSSMDEIKCRILGISEEEILNG